NNLARAPLVAMTVAPRRIDAPNAGCSQPTDPPSMLGCLDVRLSHSPIAKNCCKKENPDMQLDFSNRHVVVTGGTGALGAAVVEMLIDAGATVHIPAHRAPDPASFPLARHERVKIVASI